MSWDSWHLILRKKIGENRVLLKLQGLRTKLSSTSCSTRIQAVRHFEPNSCKTVIHSMFISYEQFCVYYVEQKICKQRTGLARAILVEQCTVLYYSQSWDTYSQWNLYRACSTHRVFILYRDHPCYRLHTYSIYLNVKHTYK